MDPFIADYLKTKHKMPAEEIRGILEFIAENKDIEAEFSFYTMTEFFPPAPLAINIGGYTAEYIYKKYVVAPVSAYLFLVGLSLNFNETEKRLKKEKKRIAPPIAIYLEQAGKMLIKKYDSWFIRFSADDNLWDVSVTGESAEKIMNGNDIETELEAAMNSYPLYRNAQIYTEISSYLRRWNGLEYTDGRCVAELFMTQPDVAEALYRTLMCDNFPEHEICEYGYTPSKLFYAFDVGLWESYMYMIQLRTDRAAALAVLDANKETAQ